MGTQLSQLKQKVETLEREVKRQKRTTCVDNNFALNQFDEPSDFDVLALNVGGTHFDVLRATLTCIPGLLATKFGGEWDKSLPRDATGRFFLDEDPELFCELVRYLRDYNRSLPLEQKIFLVTPTFQNADKVDKFRFMLESFHMVQHFYPWKVYSYSVEDESITIEADPFYRYIKPRNFDSYFLLQRNTPSSQRIVAFEVQLFLLLSTKQDCSFGWKKCTIDERCPITGELVDEIYWDTVNRGISRYIAEGTAELLSSNLPDITILEHPTIRCANRGAKWYLNGELVVDLTEDIRKLDLERYEPFVQIQGEGSFRITKIELEQ